MSNSSQRDPAADERAPDRRHRHRRHVHRHGGDGRDRRDHRRQGPTTPADLLAGLLDSLALAADAQGSERDALLRRVQRFAHGTTAATNAYIERRGATLGLLTTRGFEDIIFQQRQLGMTAGLSPSELTDYSLRSEPAPLCPRRRVHGIRERVDYSGRPIGPLREDDVRAAAAALRDEGVDAVAICFLWSFKHPEHERRAASIVRQALPGAYVCASCDVAPRLGEYERTATTLVNAYLGPPIARYAGTLESELRGRGSQARIVLLDSDGGVMTPAEAARAPIRLLLSGPSGGVTASRHVGRALAHSNVITFDMGGTSTDVGLIVDGEPVRRTETIAEKYHLLAAMVDIQTIGAGGGSIARVERGGYLHVGPESAGAQPGPACYGRGGERPTVTDADLVLGVLDPERFLGGRLALDVGAARDALRRHVAQPLGMSVERAAVAIKRDVDARMADLVRRVTIERGHDPRDFVLYAFGGAGATHAPAFALQIVDEIVVPASQSVHSAMGAIASDARVVEEMAVPMRLARGSAVENEVDVDELRRIFAGLERRALDALAQQDVDPDAAALARVVEMRFTRQTKAVPVAWAGSVGRLIDDFLAAYAKRYGAEGVPDLAGVELVTFVVSASGPLPRPRLAREAPRDDGGRPAPAATRSVYNPEADELVPTAVYDDAQLAPGDVIDGPAIVEYAGTTLALVSGQRASVDAYRNVSIRSAA